MKGGDYTANFNRLIKKLQTALLQYDCRIKIHTRQFYSEDQNRMITVYALLEPMWSERSEKMVDKEVYSSSSTAKVAQYMAARLEVFRNEAEP